MKRFLVMACVVLFLGSFVFTPDASAERMIDNKDGTVTDTQTGLMWAKKDNGRDINWAGAKSYCEGYAGGGKSGWRMPTMSELEFLYNSYWRRNWNLIKVTGLNVWAGDAKEHSPSSYSFDGDGKRYTPLFSAIELRALPVRNVR